MVSPDSVSSLVGSHLSLTCSSGGYPPPSYQWSHHLVTGTILVVGYHPVLVIPSIDYDSSGHYVCTVVNTIGNTSYSVDSSPVPLTVRGPPIIKDSQLNKEVRLGEGTSSDIRIPFCSFPPPTTAWLLSVPGHKDQRVTLLGDSSYDRFSASLRWEDSVGHCYEAVLHIQY